MQKEKGSGLPEPFSYFRKWLSASFCERSFGLQRERFTRHVRRLRKRKQLENRRWNVAQRHLVRVHGTADTRHAEPENSIRMVHAALRALRLVEQTEER